MRLPFLLAASILCSSASAADLPAKPNIILVVIDDARADRFGAYGADPKATPRFDELAKESVVFDSAFSQAGWTLPSVSSILTGLYPTVHGVVRALPGDWPTRLARGHLHVQPGSYLHDTRTTLAATLRAHGYHTAAAVSCPFGDPLFGFGVGVEDYRNLGGSFLDVDREVSRLLSSLPKDKPFFLYIHTMDAHMGGEDGAEADDATPEQRRETATRYAAMIAAADAGLGALVADLRARGLLDTTILAVTADHGEALWERGESGHGDSPYEESLRVPLLVRAPGVKPRRVAVPVQSIDLFPTFLDLAGLPPQAGVEGSSLKPEMVGRAGPERVAYTEVYPHSPPMNDRLLAVAARTPEWTYVLRPDGSEEFYDRRKDPLERTDLAKKSGAVLSALRARTEEWRSGVARAAAALPQVPEAPRVLPPDEAERLRKAGYLK
jgi:arylsulfatase A-like enzyme